MCTTATCKTPKNGVAQHYLKEGRKEEPKAPLEEANRRADGRD